MSTTTGLPPNAAAYLDALRAELADLAPEERDDLLSEVEPSLLEAAADGDEPLAARLGSPALFAADLRASAGLPPAPPPPSARAGFGTAWREIAAHHHVARALPVLRELAPVWWVVRAYVAVEMLAIISGRSPERVAQTSRYPEIPASAARSSGSSSSCSPSRARSPRASGPGAGPIAGAARGSLERRTRRARVPGRVGAQRVGRGPRHDPDHRGRPRAGERLGLRRRPDREHLRVRPQRPAAAGHPALRLVRQAAGRRRGCRGPEPPHRPRRDGRGRAERLPAPLLRAGHPARREPRRRRSGLATEDHDAPDW